MMLYSSVSCQLLAQAEEFSSQFILNHDVYGNTNYMFD